VAHRYLYNLWLLAGLQALSQYSHFAVLKYFILFIVVINKKYSKVGTPQSGAPQQKQAAAGLHTDHEYMRSVAACAVALENLKPANFDQQLSVSIIYM